MAENSQKLPFLKASLVGRLVFGFGYFFSHLAIFPSRIGILFLFLDDSCKVSAQSENVNENLEKNIKANPLTFFPRFSLTFSD